MGHQDHVIARLESLQAGPGRVHPSADRSVHFHVVGDQHSRKGESAPQHVFYEMFRPGGGQQVAEYVRVGDVGAHDGRDSLRNEYAVGDQLPLPHLVEGDTYHGQGAVGILVRMPVPGKVLGRADDPAPGHSPVVGEGQRSGGDRIRGEGPGADDAGRRVGVHVGGRSEVHIDAEAPELLPDVIAGQQRILGQPRCAQGDVARRPGRFQLDVPDPAPLLVRGYEQGYLEASAAGRLLHLRDTGGQACKGINVPREDLDPTQVA